MAKSRHLTAIAVGYVASAVVYSRLSDPDLAFFPGSGRPMIAFLLPTAALLTYALLNRLWARDPIRDRDLHMQATSGRGLMLRDL